MEDGRIQDNQITASTFFNAESAPSNARLNQNIGEGGWSAAASDTNQWIQANLLISTMVTGVITQGKGLRDQWVTKFKVQYSDDGVSFTYVKDPANQNDLVRCVYLLPSKLLFFVTSRYESTDNKRSILRGVFPVTVITLLLLKQSI